MKKLAVVVIALGLGVLSGCASSSSGGWAKPGMTQEQLGRDTADCLASSSRMVSGLDGPRQTVDQPRYQRCMADRGYTVGPAQ